MKISVKVPATSANLGPGFDCMGLALPLYNTVTIEETVLPGTGVEINVVTEGDLIDSSTIEHLQLDENSIIYKAVEVLYNSIGQTPSELKITVHSSIPIARGLGSSSSVIIGALVAANELLGHPADEAALLSIACEIEGHPDNITPAITGGVVIAMQEDDGSVTYRKLAWPNDWYITVCIPDFELSTEIARSVLPTEISRQDAIFNAQHLGMLIQAINTNDDELLKQALHDKIHEPYRMKLIPGLDKIKNTLRHVEDVFGCVISGAGSSILIISKKNALDKIKEIVYEEWGNLGIKCNIKTMCVENNGAEIINNNDD